MYPVTYEADYLRERNRLTTFFRLIVAIPWLIVASIYVMAQMVVVFIAWFAILFVGRFPEGMYNFVGGILRFTQRVNGFMYLQTDAWPPFGIGDDDSYPIRVKIMPPAAKQSRLKDFFRLILAIPLLVLSYAMSYALMAVATISWLTIVFRGYQPAAIHNAIAYLMGWSTRATAYIYLMRDEYPPVGDETPVEVDPPAGGELPASEAAPLDPAPATEEQPPPPAQ
ncbi:MAG: DUF4389 domain-containing protein [Solirubrobacterales bacterium]|nr:DUF4389 domain-containing protein [Solirubrobacterales bacterium]